MPADWGFAGKQLTAIEVAEIAHRAGIPIGPDLVIAVAVCWGESQFWTKAFNFRGLDRSMGLWQINMLGSLAEERRRKYGLKNDEELYTPDVNARVMFQMSNKGRNWQPWGAYTHGGYIRRGGVARAEPAVEELKRRLEQGLHTVQKGESLYTIGHKYGIDWRKLARDNSLTLPYLVSPGQVLRIPPQ